jgi:hypothetical protein
MSAASQFTQPLVMQQRKPARSVEHESREGRSDGPVFTEPERPHLKAGERDMCCRSAVLQNRFGRQVVKLNFFDPLSGDAVDFFVNANAGTGSKFFEAWVIANGAPPKPRQVMSVRVFRGKFFCVEIGETTQTFNKTKLKPGEGYSVVKRVLRRTL